jgi:hypothetical protein
MLRTFVLRDLHHVTGLTSFIAQNWLAMAKEGKPLAVAVREHKANKTREQEEKYHAMIGDIAKQYEFCGRLWEPEDMKRLLLDGFRRETVNDPEYADAWKRMAQVEMAPSLDGSGVVMLGIQSRRFGVKLANGFIEWLYAFGAENRIVWSDPQTRAYATERA